MNTANKPEHLIAYLRRLVYQLEEGAVSGGAAVERYDVVEGREQVRINIVYSKPLEGIDK